MRCSHYLARLSVCITVILTPVSAQASSEDDPWEIVNRRIFTFNDNIDIYALKPLSKGYQFVTPKFVQDSVHNFFLNIGDVVNLTNNVLQLKPHDAGVDTARLLMNTIFGMLGFIDIGTKMGLHRSDEDFGQTLGYWGVGSGPYLILPLLGPSTLRDAPSKYVDSYTHPYRYINDVSWSNITFGFSILDTRVNLPDSENMITGDKYTLIRNAYLQNREFKVKDGKVVDDF